MADLQSPPPDLLYSLFGLKSPHVFAGLFGGTVRGLISKGFTWPQRIISAVVGALTAGYATPVVVPLAQHWIVAWGYRMGELEGSVGFALGLVGMTVCDALIQRARKWRDSGGSLPPPPKSSG